MVQIFKNSTTIEPIRKDIWEVLDFLKDYRADIETSIFVLNYTYEQGLTSLSDLYEFDLGNYYCIAALKNELNVETFINCLIPEDTSYTTPTSKTLSRQEYAIYDLENSVHIEDIFIDLYSIFDKPFSDKIYKRLDRLYGFQKKEDTSDIAELSIESLKTMLLFMYKSKFKSIPMVTIDDSGIFHCRWENGKRDVLIFVFYQDRRAEYLFTEKPINPQQKPYFKSGLGHIDDIIEKEINNNVFKEL